ncbi:MAG: hypothetical protein LBT12_06230 [Oscillospiraceae bacterium]|jgi:hypothetical protein|nr:hypothetical protein [Oscillospiraceae bacterium]
MHTAILIGNGLNRCFSEDLAWSKVLAEASRRLKVEADSVCVVQPTFYFEYIMNKAVGKPDVTVFSKDNDIYYEQKVKVAEIIGETAEKTVPQMGYYQKFTQEMTQSVILTTNYDYLLERSFVPGFVPTKNGADGRTRANSIKYSLNLKNEVLTADGVHKAICHVHGELGLQRTICLGFGHYSGAIGKIKEILNKYNKNVLSEWLRQDKNADRTVEALISDATVATRFTDDDKVKKEDKRKKAIEESVRALNECWASVFFSHDLHIVGFGLDFSELDIWWLIQHRSYLKNFVPSFENLINNKIIFHNIVKKERSDETCAKERFLAGFGVACEHIQLDASGYKETYSRILASIKPKTE